MTEFGLFEEENVPRRPKRLFNLPNSAELWPFQLIRFVLTDRGRAIG